MQWMLPPPKATSRVWTPTICRSGNICCSLLDGQLVVFIAVLRGDDGPVDDEEIHIRGDADLAVFPGYGTLHGVDGLGALQPAGLTGQAQLKIGRAHV